MQGRQRLPIQGCSHTLHGGGLGAADSVRLAWWTSIWLSPSFSCERQGMQLGLGPPTALGAHCTGTISPTDRGRGAMDATSIGEETALMAFLQPLTGLPMLCKFQKTLVRQLKVSLQTLPTVHPGKMAALPNTHLNGSP